MASSCLVTMTMEERGYTQSFFTNATIDAQGGISESYKTWRRTVTETTTFYKGMYTDVKAAVITAAGAQGGAIVNPYEIRRSDGPWWEATVTVTVYGDWEEVVPDPSQAANE